MKKFKLNKKIIIIAIIAIVALGLIIFGTYKTIKDENKLTVEENIEFEELKKEIQKSCFRVYFY